MNTKRLLGLLSLMLMLSISASAQLEYWSVYVPQFDYQTEFIRTEQGSRGLTLANLSDYLFVSVDHDKGLLTLSLLTIDSATQLKKSDPIATMHREDPTFSYVDPSRERYAYYFENNVFSAMVFKGGEVKRSVRITIDQQPSPKGRRVTISSGEEIITTIWW